MKTGVSIQGDDGVVIRSRSEPAISMIDVTGVSLINLTIVGEDAGAGAIFMHGSRHIVLERCRVHSDRNAMMGISVTGCIARECELDGQVNGAYFIWSRDVAFRAGTHLVGQQNGVLLYGSSARFVGCSLNAVNRDCIIFIPPRRPWMQGWKVPVHVGSAGTLVVWPALLQASSPQRDDLIGSITCHLYGLLVENTQLIAGNAAIAATTLEPVAFDDYHTEAGSTKFALIQGPQALPVKTAGLALPAALAVIEKTLNPLEYRPATYAPLPPRWLRWLTGNARVE